MTSKVQKPNHLMLFDLEVGGHHAGYIRHLLHYWPSKNDQPCPDPSCLAGRISLVVSPEFLRKHLDVVKIRTAANVKWVAISEAELSWYQATSRSLVRRAWVEWRLFCRYAKRLRANQALIMYVDRFQLPLALRLPVPCNLSGIYFRPTFHYQSFLGYNAFLKACANARSERVRAFRQSLLWRLACRHPRLKVLFSLDPLAVEPLQRFGKMAKHPFGTKVVHLPDPVELYAKETGSRMIDELRDELGIEAGRRVFLLFGVLSERKGIYELLDCLNLLATSELARLSLLLVGQVTVTDEARLQAKIHSISRAMPIQIIMRNQFIAEEDVALYFELADVILAPYQRHVGMSGILVLAAAASKPVLASNYGLMGEMVRRRSLGITVDSTKPNEIAKGVSAFLEGEPTEMFDSQSAAQFARENSAERFARVVWENLGI